MVFLINTWAACRNIIFYQISVVLDAPNLSQVPLSFLGFFLVGFPPTLAYKEHPAAIGVKILSTVQEEFIITGKDIRFEVVTVPGFFFVQSSRLDPKDHKGILLILGSLGFILIICKFKQEVDPFLHKILNGTSSFRCALQHGVDFPTTGVRAISFLL